MRAPALAGLLLLTACAKRDFGRADDIFGGAAEVVEESDRVEAFRIRAPESGGDYRNYPATARPVILDPETRNEVRRLFLDEASYEPKESWKSCLLRPGIRLVFARGDRRVVVHLCLRCCYLLPDPGRSTLFDPAAAAFRALALRLFPEDAEFRALKE